ncbi:MAG: anthranilate phosphoribosyltransferase [Pseudomonadota bacterium]
MTRDAATTAEHQPTPIAATQADMRNCVAKVATGPEYSKNLSQEEARAGMALMLDGQADLVQAAIYLIGLRMKRETADENRGVLQAILERREQTSVEVDELIDVADPYNGQVRGLPSAPFLAPVLAACGVPAFSHGVASLGPKFGITHHRVLHAAGIPVDLNPQQAASAIADPNIGWAYLDQHAFCPLLYDLVDLRNRMIKRSVIHTIEVMTKPLRARKQTHLLTGYVHKAYPPVYADLARFAGFESAAIVRGVEGGVIPSLQQPSRFYQFYSQREEDQFISVEPTQLGIEASWRAVSLPDGAKSIEGGSESVFEKAVASIVKQGEAALGGKSGAVFDSLMYAAAIALLHLNRFDTLTDAAEHVQKILKSGAAFDRFVAMRDPSKN